MLFEWFFRAILRSRQNQQKHSPFAALYFCGYFVWKYADKQNTKHNNEWWLLRTVFIFAMFVCTCVCVCLCNAECSPLRSLTSFYSFTDLTFLFVAYLFLKKKPPLVRRMFMCVCELVNVWMTAYVHTCTSHMCGCLGMRVYANVKSIYPFEILTYRGSYRITSV